MRHTANNNSKIVLVALLMIAVLSCFPQHAGAAQMSDYCITPPYISSGRTPNLLLMIDNSSSMNDLQYVDKGTATRNPTYCYDNTYQSTQTYAGYFTAGTYYDYNFTNNDFTGGAAYPASCAGGETLVQDNSNVLFVCYNGSTRKVTSFLATGNFLNWLTMSKFDVQKQILTGGKYDPVDKILTAETRGCVGRKFIKQPLTTDYVEGGPNTPLGITFGISGPTDPYNPSAPSPAGQTEIDIFIGTYNSTVCQQVIDDFADPAIQKQDLIDDIEACIGYSATNKDTCQYDSSVICNSDADCGYSVTAGTCGSVAANGTCSPLSGGVCTNSGGGTCFINNGTCPATTGLKGVCVGGSKAGTACDNNTPCKGNGTCTRYCAGGGKAGAVCGTNAGSDGNLCKFSQCTSGDTSKTSCAVNSDCDLKKCSNAGLKFGQTCTAASDCNSGKCTAGKLNTTDCLVNADCNQATSVCTAGKVGFSCAVNSDCDNTVIGKGQCLPPASVQIKSTYGQTMHTCYQVLFKGQSLQQADRNYVMGNNGCDSIYKAYYACLGGANDGLTCTGAADCPGGSCIRGPGAIRPGSPVLICGYEYAGYCASSTDGWATTNWNPMSYLSANDCVDAAIMAYCNASQVSDVTDPTDDASATSNFANLPAILSGTGLEGQLGSPIAQLPVRVSAASEPKKLIQEFGNKIRMGAMTFNTYGTPSECTTTYPPPVNAVPCPKTCSTDATILCGSNQDCPSPASATCAVNTNNYDGAKIIHYIGTGHCTIVPATACTLDADCTTAGDTCKAEVGDHTSGLIREIDDIKASTWTPFSEGFYNAIGYFGQMPTGKSNTNLRINTADFDENKNPSQIPCQMNNLLLITDGMSTADLASDVGTFASLYTSGSPTLYGPSTGSACSSGNLPYSGSKNLDNIAWAAKNRKISDLTNNVAISTVPIKSNESISTFVVLAGASNGLSGECNSQTLLSNTAKNGGTELYTAETPSQLDAALTDALNTISSTAAAGTAASVLASGEGSGANLIQAVFYPQKKFPNTALGDDDKVNWTGRLTNLWYYVDPFLGNSSIREDNGCATCTTDPTNKNPSPWGGDKTLDLLSNSTTTTGDYTISMYFDSADVSTKADRWTDNGTGVISASTPTVPTIGFEDLGYLWEAGTLLWERDLATSPRRIITSTSSGSTLNFSTANAGTLAPFMTSPTNTTTASNIIKWVHGVDYPDTGAPATSVYRSRTVKVESIDTTARVWKLGDVVNSTPKLMSWPAFNSYGLRYSDPTYGSVGLLKDPVKVSSFVTTTQYKQRGVVFAGGNDGMLHAFKLGTLQLQWSGQKSTQKARMLANYDVTTNSGSVCTAGTTTIAPTCGQELWAFIPKSVLPYLQYLADPGYCHLNSVDLTPFIFDASINGDPDATRDVNSWRTILIGGMRFGGACKSFSNACTSPGCVKNPMSNDVGYSSYFALDVTDQNNPTLLWEFSDPDLGFTTTGPAVIRINNTTNKTNGNWFVVFGSGPTGPISTSDHQFLGQSDQPLRLFVLDLKTGPANKTVINTGITNAFAGSLLGGPLDVDDDYQDEVLYIPYVEKDTSANTWTNGGVLRLMTKKSNSPAAWELSSLIDDIGPVTSAVVKINDYTQSKLWVYFGEGRYYYLKTDSSDDPNPSVERRLFGLKDTCRSHMLDNTLCTDTIDIGDLSDVSSDASKPEDLEGWVISLDAQDASSGLNSERVITDPLATLGGVVYFTTYKSYTNLCTLGGKTFIWAMKYDTGGCVDNLKGKVLVQVSTGAIEQQDLSLIFGCEPPNDDPKIIIDWDDPKRKKGRRTDAIEGKPPEMQGLSVVSTPLPVNRTIHIRER